MIKLTRGQKMVLSITSAPMAAVGLAGGVASYFNFASILGHANLAASMVLAGEGATLVAALVYLLLTLLGQHTPKSVRAGLWLLPLTGSAAGAALAPTVSMRIVMAVSPLAMTVSAEGVALVARRVVAFQSGTDLEQQRRSGLLLWHANRSQNGSWYGRRVSRVAVWRLTRQFAATDTQLSVQLSEVQRSRITEGADANLAAALSGTAHRAAPSLKPLGAPVRPALPSVAAAQHGAAGAAEGFTEPLKPVSQAQVRPAAPAAADDPDGFGFITSVLAEAEQHVAGDRAQLLSITEAAELLGVSSGTVRSWKTRGKLRVADVQDGRPMFHRLDVLDLGNS